MNLTKNIININIIEINPRPRNEPYGPKITLADIHNLDAIKEKIPLTPS
jgi:hypothetical protein